MISHYHDFGWGPQWPAKQIEHEMVSTYLKPLALSNLRTVLINSTWYSRERHQSTMQWLRANDWDVLVLISMIDPAIITASWFEEFDRPVLTVGGYRQHHLSLWAEIAARNIPLWHDRSSCKIHMPFMCLNRKPHHHRVRLYQQLEELHLLDKGLVSLGAVSVGSAVRSISEQVQDPELAPNGQALNHGIPNDIASLGDRSNWEAHFLNIVTETTFDVDGLYFVSEKIFKPMIGLRPFLVYAPGGAQLWLKDQGFETYLDDFKDIYDGNLRDPNNIPSLLARIGDLGPEWLQQKYLDLLPKMLYNQDRFTSFVKEQRDRIQQGISCPI